MGGNSGDLSEVAHDAGQDCCCWKEGINTIVSMHICAYMYALGDNKEKKEKGATRPTGAAAADTSEFFLRREREGERNTREKRDGPTRELPNQHNSTVHS